MELIYLIAIIVVVVVAVIGVISFVRNISSYYRDRFRFSIWSGTFILLFAIALLILASSGIGAVIAEIIASLLAALVIYKDIRLAGFGWGILAVGLQVLFAVSFLFMLVFLVIGYFIRRVFYPRRSARFPTFGLALGMNGEISFLLNFLRF